MKLIMVLHRIRMQKILLIPDLPNNGDHNTNTNTNPVNPTNVADEQQS